MANEAVIIELCGQPKGVPVRYAIGNAVAVEKGTLMKMSGARACAVALADNDLFAGIAAEEKVANDGATSIGLWTKGIFDLKTNANSIAVGERVKLSGANCVDLANDDTIANAQEIVGVALESAAADDTIAVAVGIY